MFIVMANEFFDLGNKLFCAPKRAPSYGLFRDMPEPVLDVNYICALTTITLVHVDG
jgi:hypothetical protein